MKQPYAGSAKDGAGPVPIHSSFRAFTAKLRAMREARQDVLSETIAAEGAALIHRILRDKSLPQARAALREMLLLLPIDLRPMVVRRIDMERMTLRNDEGVGK